MILTKADLEMLAALNGQRDPLQATLVAEARGVFDRYKEVGTQLDDFVWHTDFIDARAGAQGVEIVHKERYHSAQPIILVVPFDVFVEPNGIEKRVAARVSEQQSAEERRVEAEERALLAQLKAKYPDAD